MSDDFKVSEVVFLFGAGASVPAGIPDTRGFVREFVRHLAPDSSKQNTVKEILRILSKWKNSGENVEEENWDISREIDIELLLETLNKLRDKADEPLLQFFKNCDFRLQGYNDKEPLINDLKNFIKTKAIAREEATGYLAPLRDFAEEYKPLTIISMNYDTCVEHFANVNKLTYQDGFDVNWNPKTFVSEHTDLCLLKLHGSIIWYQTDRGGYVKVPVRTESGKIQLITGEEAESLMLYPMQKMDYAEPLLELSVLAKRILESAQCRFLVVVGYSFRDAHIRRMLWDAARRNDFHVVLVAPDAYSIYQERLECYDAGGRISSSLKGRVICLPFPFESVFPYLRTYFIYFLKEGLSLWDKQHLARLKGDPPDWRTPAQMLAASGFIEKVVPHPYQQLTFAESEIIGKVELGMHIAIHQCLNPRALTDAEATLKNVNSLLHEMFVERLAVEEGSLPNRIMLKFNTTASYPHLVRIQVLDFVRRLEQNILFYRMLNGKLPELLRTLGATIAYLREYLEALRDSMEISTYEKERRELVQEAENWELLKASAAAIPSAKGELAMLVEKIEKEFIGKIFSRP